MDFKELLKKHGVEENLALESDIAEYVTKEIAKDYDDGKSVPYDKFAKYIKIKNDALDELAEAKSKIETLTSNSNTQELEDLKKENEALKAKNQEFETERFNTGIENIKPYYEKLIEKDGDEYKMKKEVLDLFGEIPEKIEDFTPEYLQQFNSTLKPLKVAGIFDNQTETPSKGTPPGGGRKPSTPIDPLQEAFGE